MRTFQILPLSLDEAFTKAYDLFRQHWEEIARNKDVMVLRPVEAKYRELEAIGQFFALGLYADGELIGYSGNFIGPHIHYADLTVCNNDVLFVAKPYRQSRAGMQLIRATEDEARERGARLMLWHAKERTALAELMPRIGYSVQDIIFSKEI